MNKQQYKDSYAITNSDTVPHKIKRIAERFADINNIWFIREIDSNDFTFIDDEDVLSEIKSSTTPHRHILLLINNDADQFKAVFDLSWHWQNCGGSVFHINSLSRTDVYKKILSNDSKSVSYRVAQLSPGVSPDDAEELIDSLGMFGMFQKLSLEHDLSEFLGFNSDVMKLNPRLVDYEGVYGEK